MSAQSDQRDAGVGTTPADSHLVVRRLRERSQPKRRTITPLGPPEVVSAFSDLVKSHRAKMDAGAARHHNGIAGQSLAGGLNRTPASPARWPKCTKNWFVES